MRELRAPARLCLLAALVLCWLNYLLTARWAHVPGALHGEKEPWIVALLSATTLLAIITRVGAPTRLGRVAPAMAIVGVAFLALAFLRWFPVGDWDLTPFQDNWPARYQSTVDQIALFRRGAVVGWQWAFLGGYHLSSDLTVTLAALGWMPMAVFGAARGFHVLHALLFAAVPLLVWLEMKDEPQRDAGWVAVGLAGLLAASYSYRLLGSGDTNSLAGACATMFALHGAAAMRRKRWGGPLLIAGLVLVIYSHAGFLLFTLCYLALHVALTRDRRHGMFVLGACAIGFVGGLPLSWESLVYPDYFTANNAVLHPPPFDALSLARKVYYNVELLVQPGRWLNDATGVAIVFLPIALFTAVRGSERARFYALAWLLTLGITRLYDPEQFGWGLIRAAHMHALFAAPVLGWFIASCCSRRALAASVFALIAVYVQVAFSPVPHVRSVLDFDAALVQRIVSAEQSLVLIENSYHPEMDEDPSRQMESTPFPAHFEALLPSATGRRFYAGVWDGWQWAPARRNLLANGSWGGRRVDLVADSELLPELRRWGVTDLMVWSRVSIDRLSTSEAFSCVWHQGKWHQFRMRASDSRTVETASGEGRLVHVDPLGATVAIDGARIGDLVVVRTNYHPAWNAVHNGVSLRLFDADGRLAFHAPADGDISIELVYPRRLWLIGLASFISIGGAIFYYKALPR